MSRANDRLAEIEQREIRERERTARLTAALAAYRSAVRSGERESEQLRAMGDAALAAAGEEQL